MTGTLWAALGLLVTLIGALLGARRIGAREQVKKHEAAEGQAYQNTTKETADAPVHTDAAVARERMRARDPRKP